MTLLRRRPREVYRVYSEEEYLDGAGSGLAGVAEWHAGEPELTELGSAGEWQAGEPELGSAGEWQGGEPELTLGDDWQLGDSSLPVEELGVRHAEWDVSGHAGQGFADHRLRRAAGVAMLAGALGAVGGLVCLNLARAHGGSRAGRESLVAATHPARAAAGSAPAAGDARPRVQSSRPVIVRPVETVGSRVAAQSRRSRAGGPALRRSDRLPAHPAAHRSTGVAVLADYAHRRPPSSSEASVAPVSASAPAQASAQVSAPVQAPAPTASSPSQPAPEAASTTSAAVSAPPAHTAPETQAEFGFER
jgi:hypothetical protein